MGLDPLSDFEFVLVGLGFETGFGFEFV